MSSHTREQIHPECKMLTDASPVCNCDDLSLPTDDSRDASGRAIEIATRLEARSNPVSAMGHGPDADESEHGGATAAVFGDVRPDDRSGLTVVERGFWKNSEHERCNAGLDFAAGEMKFPIKRDPSSTWARAAESQA